MRRRHIVIGAATAFAVVAAAVVVAEVALAPQGLTITASSTRAGTDAQSLSDADPAAAMPTWSSDGEVEGAWVNVTWPRQRTVDHVQIFGPGDDAIAIKSGVLQFSDGSSLLVTAGGNGDLTLDFPERTVDAARLTVVEAAPGATSVALNSWLIDDSGSSDAGPWQEPVVRTSSGDESGAGALHDGNADSGDLGSEWQASPSDDSPWVELEWDTPVELASMQVHGPRAAAFDPGYSAAADLWGELHFDDGSTVVVSGIKGDDHVGTTVAFKPRVTKSVRLELHRTIDAATFELQEVAAYPTGTTPPVWSASVPGPTYSAAAPAIELGCGISSEAVGTAMNGEIALVCPETGAGLGRDAVIVVETYAGLSLMAESWVPDESDSASGAMLTLASAVADESGRAEFTFDPSSLPYGPLGIRISSTVEDASQPLSLMFFNSVGSPEESQSPGHEGMTLQWSEEFDAPLSVSQSGEGATYAATKPAYWGGSEFGDAVFADPALGLGNLQSVDDRYLRVRGSAIGATTDPYGWDRQHTGGILSSLRVGAGGFAAQYGYYEARMYAQGGNGTWPAFWMLNSESATKRTDSSGEVDAVELYGHNTVGSCHSLYNWNSGEDDPNITCIRDNGLTDWSLAWHTYGVQIRPGGADYYIDGQLMASSEGLHFSDEPFYFMANLALGGGWPVELDTVGNDVELYVDWIRVYT